MLQHQRFMLFLGDLVSLMLAFAAMIVLRFNIHSQQSFIFQQAVLFAWLFAIWLIVFFIFDLYNLRRVNPNPRNIGLLLTSTALNLVLGIVFFYFFSKNGITPKTNLVLVSLFSLILLILWRRWFYHLFTVRFTRSIATIGTSPLIIELRSELQRHPHFGGHTAHWDAIADANTGNAVNILIAEHADPQALLAIAQALQAETLTLTESYETFFAKIPVTLMTDEKAITIMTRHDNKAMQFFYRCIEILFAVFVLIITSPFMLIAIIARLIEDGRPIFIKQKRVGKNGNIFTIHKLRSMKALSSDGSAETNGAQWAEKRDLRVTPVGRIIRLTHLDEVPQMINIIKGDIALVGPRPERPEFVSQLEQSIPYYFLRHTIRPGFTGWAQIKYRYARTVEDAQEKFEYDLYYLKNRTPLLDIGIVVKTLQIIFTH
jgi:lipopolysaccharide/colanic/teichoic acid biosynthesis glycosyltransferase